jgi:hypothetical protein
MPPWNNLYLDLQNLSTKVIFFSHVVLGVTFQNDKVATRKKFMYLHVDNSHECNKMGKFRCSFRLDNIMYLIMYLSNLQAYDWLLSMMDEVVGW